MKAKGKFIASCKKHEWLRTAVFYASEEQTCTNCGKKRIYKKERLN